MNHVARDLLQHARESPAAVLLVDEAGNATRYGEAARLARDFAGGLEALEVEPGRRVLVLLPNGPEYLAAYYGSLIHGCTVVAVQPQTIGTALEHIARDCEPTVCIAAGRTTISSSTPGVLGRVFAVQELMHGSPFTGEPRGGDDDIAQIIYTSGTTGKSKGVALSHRAIRANATGIVEYLGLTRHDRVGVVLDFVYSYGNSLLQTHCRVGGSLALLGSLAFPAHAVQLLAERRCTGLSGVPATFALLLQRGHIAERPLPDMRYLTCAGGALPEANLRRLQELLPDIDIYLMYGQTEASARLSYLPPEQLDRRPRSIGKGMPGVSLEVLRPDDTPVEPGEEGEIVAEGDNLMSGYWRDPETTRQVLRDGKLWTGDLATVDDEGFIYITGRKSDLIKTGAYRVHPKEVEEAIISMPGVHECVVLGIPDPTWGEIVIACFRRGLATSLTELRKHLRGRLPEYKWPRRVFEVDEIPRTASGKPRRRELARRLSS